MNPAVLKALVEALKRGGRFLGHNVKATPVTRRAQSAAAVEKLNKPPLWRGKAPAGKPGTKELALPMGRANRVLYGPPKSLPRGYLRAGAYGVGGVGTASAIGSALFGEDEKQQQPNPVLSDLLGQQTPEWEPDSDIESRVQFQKNTRDKYNRQMKKLLLNYGIVNLANPDSAKDMLKIGMAILEQNIASGGDARQAKIFDSVFKSGSMPKTARVAAERILKAGGDQEDADAITGIYAASAPAKTSQKKEDVAAQVIATIQQLLAVGSDSQARKLLRQYIMSNHIGRTQDPSGIEQPIDVQVEEWIKLLSDGAVNSRNPGGVVIHG
jgi:hypothetical protein